MMIWLTLAVSAAAGVGAVPAAAAVIDHVALHVADPARSATFYQSVLGLRPLTQRASATMRWLGADTFQLHLIGGRTSPVDEKTETHFAFRVPDLQNELKILDQQRIPWTDSDGVPHTITTRFDGVLQVYFHDPDGYAIEVNQAPK